MKAQIKTLVTATCAALMTTTAIVRAEPSAELIAAAEAEGTLTTIALPHDWCGYGAVIDGFKKKYPKITVNELNPDAGSADELPLQPDGPTVADVTGAEPDDPDATVAMPWMPVIETRDDLGGLLHAESPLLARAFLGTARPR